MTWFNLDTCVHQRFLLSGEAAKFTHVIIDEHHDHIICPEDRKDAWRQLADWTSRVNMPVILLSGTNPPALQHQILANFGLREDHTAFIRSPTNRSELGLHVIRIDPFAGLAGLARLVFALLGKLQADERMLVFFECCQLAESFAKEHDFAVYHSKLLGSDVKRGNLGLWDSGRTKVMACTSAFGFGVDRPNIRFVVIFNPKHSLLTMMQMAGRAGRDGREAHIFLATLEQSPARQEKNDPSFALELGQLIHQQICRVYQAMYSIDGPDMARTCAELQGQVPCDVCQPSSEMHIFATRAVHPMQRSIRSGAKEGARTLASSPHGVDNGFTTARSLLERTLAQTSKALTTSRGTVPLGISLATDIFEDKRSIWPGPKVCVCCTARGMGDKRPTHFQLTSQPNPSARSQPDRRLTSAASMPDLHFSNRSEDSSNATRARLNRTAELDRYMPLLQGKCPYHFVLEGELEVDHFPGCELEAELSSSSSGDFQAFKGSFLFKKFTYCFTCGMPQDKKMNGEGPRCHAAHNWAERKPCKFGSFIFRATFCIWQSEDLRQEMIKGLGVTEPIAEQEEFTEWAKRDLPSEGKYHNCLEVFLWFCRRKEHVNPKYFLH